MSDLVSRGSSFDAEYDKFIAFDPEGPAERLSKKKSEYPKILYASFIFALLVGFLAGFQAAQYKSTIPYDSNTSNSVPQVQPSIRVFIDDKRFSTPPPKDSSQEKAWDSLLPKGLGLVKHPKLAVKESMIAAFHQLHCLYTLRRIFFSEARNETLESFDNGVERGEHVPHCFEYLRQALMCSADSSLEPTEVEEGFPGWGFGRKCRDYEQLKSWAAHWRTNDLEGFILHRDDFT